MADPKNKLPRSILVLNIIMIIIVLIICGLVVSLLYSDAVFGSRETSADISVSSSANGSGSTEGTTATTTTTPKSTVSMTKRSTEPTEPVSEPAEETAEAPLDNSEPDNSAADMSYSKEFFSEDLFIGDSITTGIYLYNKLDMKNVAAGVGYTPYKAYTETIDLFDGTSATALEYAKKMQPKRIYIMLGSNGILAASAMEDSYRTLISKLTSVCPDSKLYCLSVPPITSDSSLAASGGIELDMITGFNSFIKGICSELGIVYIDLYNLVSGSDGYFLHEYAENDGLHFKGITYDLMLSHIEDEISG